MEAAFIGLQVIGEARFSLAKVYGIIVALPRAELAPCHTARYSAIGFSAMFTVLANDASALLCIPILGSSRLQIFPALIAARPAP